MTAPARPLTPRRTLTAASALLGASALLLSGCTVAGTERPPEIPSVEPEDVTPVPVPEDFEAVPVVDVSPGGGEDGDHVWQGLAEAVAEGEQAYLHAWVRTYDELPEDGEVSLTPEFPDSMTVTVDSEAVTADADDPAMKLVEGTFDVEQLGGSAFVLTVESTDAEDELHPQGPDSQERCTADDGNERIQAAAQLLASAIEEGDAEAREEQRLQWTSAPAVWWGIQRTALDLAESEQEFAGDFLLEACAPYLEG